MMLYQALKLFGVWGMGAKYPEEGIINVSRNARWWARACATVENDLLGKESVPPWRLVL
jgi:hypothetical protein